MIHLHDRIEEIRRRAQLQRRIRSSIHVSNVILVLLRYPNGHWRVRTLRTLLVHSNLREMMNR